MQVVNTPPWQFIITMATFSNQDSDSDLNRLETIKRAQWYSETFVPTADSLFKKLDSEYVLFSIYTHYRRFMLHYDICTTIQIFDLKLYRVRFNTLLILESDERKAEY